mgnify:FL=1
MADTFSQIHLHLIFGVKNRIGLIHPRWKNDLYSYIGGVITNNGCTPIKIGGHTDHVHILLGMSVTTHIPSLVKAIKLATNKWVNERHLTRRKFEWQNGYGVFSCSPNRSEELIRYIDGQEEHHRVTTFREEYMKFLRSYKVAFSEDFVFQELL